MIIPNIARWRWHVMQLRNKYYPYPIVESTNIAYVTTKFYSDVDFKKDAYNYRLEFISSVNDEKIEGMIKSGELVYTFHIECPQTGFRIVHCTDENKSELAIDGDKLNGKVQVCTFITAQKDIVNYENQDFIQDYKGIKFKIGANCVFGIGKLIEFDVCKQHDELSGTASIFSIIINMDENEKSIKINMSGEKIELKMPKEAYYKYKNMGSQQALYTVFNAMIIFPAMVYVLKELQGHIDDYNDRRWFKSLRKTFKSLLELELDEQTLESMDVYEKAQKLLKEPYDEAVAFLARGYDEV